MVIERRIRCVLFDLGSTLWINQEEAVARANERAYELAGTLLRRANGDGDGSASQAQVLGKALRKSISQQARQQRLPQPDYEPDFALATVEALRQLGFTHADRELGASLFEALRVRIPDAKVLFADTLTTLTELKRRGYLLGVVTNRAYGGALFREDLQTMGLLDHFEYRHMAISIDLGIRKPHPEIFKYALNGLEVAAEETAMVGDNFVADIVGATRLNMFAFWKPKPSLSPAIQEQYRAGYDGITPDATITHLAELLEIL
jgi:putative hydrolase of the HAD superfamily